jgi:short/branched chain acyl-CoA dehydrogenase
VLNAPRSGSDAFAMKTRARQDVGNGRWIIDGSKCWISGAKEAGFFLVFANAAPELKWVPSSTSPTFKLSLHALHALLLRHKGITAFIVDAGNPGLHVGRNEHKLGIRASSTCEVSFTDCVVDADAVLGGVGNGYKIAIGLLNEGRIGIAFQTVGLAQGAFHHAMQVRTRCARVAFMNRSCRLSASIPRSHSCFPFPSNQYMHTR